MDPAVARVLGISDPSRARVTSHGGSGFTSTHRISVPSAADDDHGGGSGGERDYFMKVGGPGAEAETMFRGEHASLNAIHAAVPSLCPRSLGHGRLESSGGGGYFLVTEFLDLSGRGSSSSSSGKGSGMSMAQKLAKLHTTPAPVPDGHDKPMFGFPETTCCGDTAQANGYRASWADFYADNRLRAIWAHIQRNRGKGDQEMGSLLEATASRVVPRLLRDGHLGGAAGITPVVVHGDLWSGNASVGRIGGSDAVEQVVFDPSACYAHSEYELGIMNMFGGFAGSLKEYHSLCPKTEPVDEYEDRVSLYELYHHLNHYSIFGGSYRSGAMSIMKRLVKKYGEG